MPDLYDDESREDLTPEDLCRQAFMRCSNWPADPLGQQGLFQGLAEASRQSGISKEAIIARCKELSAFCPTDYDLLRVAGEMAARAIELEKSAKQETQTREWQRQYGKPKPFEQADTCTCCGRLWSEIMSTAIQRQARLWDLLRQHYGTPGKWPPCRDMAPVARQLGFADYADAWERQ